MPVSLKGIDEMAAIDDHYRTRHVARRVATQQQQRAVQVFELTQASLWNAFDQSLARVGLPEIRIEFGLDVAGRNHIEAYAKPGPFQSQCFTQLDHAGPGDGV